MKRAAVALALVASAWCAVRALRSDTPEPKLLFHRFWVDHEPRGPQDKFQEIFVNGEHPFGHFGVRDAWTASLEFFHYHLVPRHEGEIDFLFGRTNERQRVRYVARRCHERGFDYCLDIGGTDRGVQHYFSKKEWEGDDLAAVTGGLR